MPEAIEAEDSDLLECLANSQQCQLVQIAHETEAAALALAVLVRLTAHAGVPFAGAKTHINPKLPAC